MDTKHDSLPWILWDMTLSVVYIAAHAAGLIALILVGGTLIQALKAII